MGVPGVILGFIARSQIRRTSGAQTDSHVALAGIIIGVVSISAWTAWLLVANINQ
jgi:hypothetical protein